MLMYICHVLSVTAASHPLPRLTLWSVYVNFYCTTSSQLFFLLFCLFNIFFTFFVCKFYENYVVTLFISTHLHLPWIHLPYFNNKAEFALTLKLQTPHGSTLLFDIYLFVMPPLNITLVLLSPCLSPFYELIHKSLNHLTHQD